MSRSLLILAVLVGAAVWVPVAPAAPADRPLRVALQGSPPSLDWQANSSFLTVVPALHIWEQLFVFNAKDEVVPWLVDTYTISPDSLTYDLTLRRGVKFHNGKEMTADDVIASLARWRRVSPGGRTTGAVIASVDKTGTHALRIRLSRPFGALLANLANQSFSMVVMPAEQGEVPANQLREYIGTGPYRFVEWRSDQYVMVERFDGYVSRPGPPSGLAGLRRAVTRQIQFRIVPEAAVRSAGLVAGDIDVALNLVNDDYGRLLRTPGLTLLVVKPDSWIGLFFNHALAPMNNLKMRQAIQAALDHNAIMFAAAGSQAFYRLDPSMMYKETVWHSTAAKELYNQRNPGRARQLLQEAGYRGEPVSLMATPSFQQFFNAGVPIKAQLEEVGINVDLQNPDWPTMIQRRGRRDQWHMLITGWGALPDPSIFAQNYHSQSGNWGWFGHPDMDRYLDAMNASANFKDRKAAFDNVQRVFYEQVTSIKLGDYFSLRGWRSNVKGLQRYRVPVFWGASME
ncbi:MAG: ABC transporter substrate-binding protein [Armatimonadota bacterium]|nr:ABC transporter substrate-binding protein [Armatimonadota bacterium]